MGEVLQRGATIITMVPIFLKVSLVMVLPLFATAQDSVWDIRQEIVDLYTKFQEKLLVLETELLKTQEDLSRTKEELRAKDAQLELKMKEESPWTAACGFSDGTMAVSETVPYNSLFFSSSNVAGAGLDISTGMFTSGHSGTYTATWSLMASDGSQEPEVVLYLRRNSENIPESAHYSRYAGSGGLVYDQGGRTLVLHLDVGDTLDLFCQDCSAFIDDLTFCVTLTRPDME